MALNTCGCSYVGKGRIYLRNKTRNGQFEFIGNASDLAITVETNELNLPDNTVLGGGDCDSITRIDSVGVNFTAFNLCSDVLAIGFRGDVTDVNATSVLDELVQGIDASTNCVLAKFASLPSAINDVTSAEGIDPDSIIITNPGSGYSAGNVIAVPGTGTDATVTVGAVDASGGITEVTVSQPGQGFTGGVTLDLTGIGDGLATVTATPFPAATFVAEVDYTISSSGLVALDTGSIGKNSLLVDYDREDQCVMEALINSGDVYELSFEGLNESKSGSAVVVDIYCVKFDPAAELGLIADEYGSLAFTGTVLSDPSKSGANISKFFRHRAVGCK